MAEERWIKESHSLRFMLAAWIGGLFTGGIAGLLVGQVWRVH